MPLSAVFGIQFLFQIFLFGMEHKSFEIIRDLREDHNLKQSDIAAILQTTQQQYSKYETGKVDPPIHCFSMLADFYHVSVDYLLGRTACANGVDAYKEPVLENYVVDNLVADVLSLNTNGRKAVFDYIALQKK